MIKSVRVIGLSFAFLAAGLISACGDSSQSEATPPESATPAPAPVAAESAPVAAEPVDMSGLPAPYNTADYDVGRRLFRQCQACHLVAADAGHRVGPNLHGLFTRSAGALEDFKYSDALTSAEFEWTPEQLDAWLANPKSFLPGNRMVFAGVPQEDRRQNLIAYLLVETAK